jgi:GTP-binding protein
MHRVGLGEPFPVSGLTGYRVGDLLDQVVGKLRELKPQMSESKEEAALSIAIIGAPNTGKSSLVNRLAQTERMVVSDLPGTTRDSIDTLIKYHGKTIRLIDTAGLKRKRFDQQGLEFYCTLRALKALDRCDVAIVVIDGTQGMTQGDLKLVNEAADRGVGVACAVNKWDIVSKDYKTADKWLAKWWERVPGLAWISLLFISALTGQRAIRVVEAAFEIKAEREKRISTAELNDTIVPQLQRSPPPAIKGRQVRIKYMSQIQASPPLFAVFSSHASTVSVQYRRFVERQVRQVYGFNGTPIKVVFREK